jgi:hypothetical protein
MAVTGRRLEGVGATLHIDCPSIRICGRDTPLLVEHLSLRASRIADVETTCRADSGLHFA